MPTPGEDPSLDDLLRAVPVPEGLSDRLRAGGGWNDEAIDRALLGVNVPADMHARLRRVPDDEALDEQIREVPIPFGLFKALRAIPRKRTTLQRLGRMAIAASVFCALTATFWSLIAVSLSLSVIPAWPPQVLAPPGPEFVESSAPPPPEIPPPEFKPTGPIVPPQPPAASTVANSPAPAPRVAPEILAEQRRQENILLSHSLPLAAPYREPDLAGDLEMVPPLGRLGLAPSTQRGFDRKFLLTKNTQPVIGLGVNSPLNTCSVPLSTAATSFDLWRKRLAEKRLPDAGEVRVEDFLAAVVYPGAPPAPGAARITAFGGVSPWGESGARLLQVTLQAGAQRAAGAAGTHLVVALDVSQSMGTFGRLDRATWALWRMVDRLEPQDRLSITAFRNDAFPVVENATRANAFEYRAALANLRPAGGANVFVGLREALNVALERAYSGERPSQVVLITDDRPVISAAVDAQVMEALRGLAASGLSLHVIDLGNTLDSSSVLQHWAAAAKGKYTTAASPQDVERALQTLLVGREVPAITAGALRVKFNPQTVAAYRLLGHEATAAGGLALENVKTSVPGYESATALFEVWLKPGSADEVAQADLDYTVDETGSRQTLRQRISRVQFAPTWAESPLSLQQAALVAETAEILRVSPFAPNKGRSLRPVLEAAEKVNARLAEWPEWQRFARLVEQTEAVRTHTARP